MIIGELKNIFTNVFALMLGSIYCTYNSIEVIPKCGKKRLKQIQGL